MKSPTSWTMCLLQFSSTINYNLSTLDIVWGYWMLDSLYVVLQFESRVEIFQAFWQFNWISFPGIFLINSKWICLLVCWLNLIVGLQDYWYLLSRKHRGLHTLLVVSLLNKLLLNLIRDYSTHYTTWREL